MKKRKVLFRELSLEIYTDGSIKLDGLNEFFNRRQRTIIMKALRQLGGRIIVEHLKKKQR